jgi:hypothetical protein
VECGTNYGARRGSCFGSTVEDVEREKRVLAGIVRATGGLRATGAINRKKAEKSPPDRENRL